jgi:hypothetical protein
MSLRNKYLKILFGIIPAGAAGVSVLLGSTPPSSASEHPAGLNLVRRRVSQNGSPPFARQSPPWPITRAGWQSRPTPIAGSRGEIGGATGVGGVGVGQIGTTGTIGIIGAIGGEIGN